MPFAGMAVVVAQVDDIGFRVARFVGC
jgi:hypothetical protein